MNVLVIGSGGREHAVIKSIKKNPAVETVWCLPGNGGIAADAVCVDIGAKDIDGIVKFASENPVDYAIVTPTIPSSSVALTRFPLSESPASAPTKRRRSLKEARLFPRIL